MTDREEGTGVGRGLRLPRGVTWSLAVALGVLLLQLIAGPLVRTLDWRMYDAVLRWQAFRQPAEPVAYVLVEIDDRSIEALGRFPWSREAFARLVEKTTQGRAVVVALDVIFSEAADPSGDQALAGALAAAGNVVLAAGAIFDRPGTEPEGEGALRRLMSAERILEPIPVFAAEAAGVGSISIAEDADGSLRRYPFILRHRGAAYPSFAQVIGAAVAEDEGGAALVGSDGTLLINYGSLSPAAIARVSFSDVLSLSPADALRLFSDKTVFVAATYTGGVDVGPTPLATRTPSTFAHIYALQTVLAGRYLRPLPGTVTFLFAVGLVVLATTQLSGRSPLGLAAAMVVLLAALFAGSLILLLFAGIVVFPTLPALSLTVMVGGYGADRWRRDQSARERAEQFLDRFVGTKLRQRRLAGAVGERAQVHTLSILSLALSDFSTDTRGLDSDTVVALARRIHEEAAAAVAAQDGTLDRVTGQGLVAFWGYPSPQPDRAARAIRAALDIKSRLRRANAELRKEGLPGLHVRMGIATGEAILADVGAEALADFTLVGRYATLADRLREAAPEGGIHLCGDTLLEGRDALPAPPFDQPPLEADGFPEPVPTFLVERPFRVWSERTSR